MRSRFSVRGVGEDDAPRNDGLVDMTDFPTGDDDALPGATRRHGVRKVLDVLCVADVCVLRPGITWRPSSRLASFSFTQRLCYHEPYSGLGH